MFTPAEAQVHIQDLSILAFVGLLPAERNEAQRILIDIDCTLKNPAVEREKLSTSVDYVPIVEAVRELCIAKRRMLIETLAEEIAAVCFAQQPAHSVRIRIRKPHKVQQCEAVGISRVFIRKED